MSLQFYIILTYAQVHDTTGEFVYSQIQRQFTCENETDKTVDAYASTCISKQLNNINYNLNFQKICKKEAE